LAGEFHSVFIGEFGAVFTCGADDVGKKKVFSDIIIL